MGGDYSDRELIRQDQLKLFMQYLYFCTKAWLAFSAADLSKEKALTLEEFQGVLKLMSMELSEEKTQGHWKALDADTESNIQFEYFCGWVLKLPRVVNFWD